MITKEQALEAWALIDQNTYPAFTKGIAALVTLRQFIEQQPDSKPSAQVPEGYPSKFYRDGWNQGLKDAARAASLFSVKPDRSLHPDIKWEDMKQEVQMAAHSAAQQIAVEIAMLNQSQEG